MNTEWKPIASAPKDGSEILVFHPEGGVCAAFCPGDGFAWHCMDGMNTVIGKKSRQSIPAMTSFMEPPTHWMPLPAPPCETCNGHGMIGGPSYYAPDEGGEPCPDCSPAAPTSHPIPTGATGERDWELACDECNGSGHVFVKHQVAERKTDVQEFKEDCECCEGRGFNIAFEDIPGIAEYVKSCRAAPSGPVDAQDDDSDIPELRSEAEIAFEEWLTREMPGGTIISNPAWWAPRILRVAKWVLRAKGDMPDAPAAGDALDWYERRRELEPDMIFRTAHGVVKLDRGVPGDGTKWYVLDWNGDGWSAYDDTIEPGDLIGAPVADHPIAIELARTAAIAQQKGEA